MQNPPPLEISFGMELYSTKFTGTGGNLKQRYEDFIVEEIDPSGRIALANISQEGPFIEKEASVSGEPRKARFIHFTVQKLGLNTMDVASLLSSSLMVSQNMITYAGLKDKRALTAQKFSAPAKSVNDLKELELLRVWIREIEYSRKQLRTGDLWGNRFRILLRNLDVSCKEACERASEIARQPILNYFGIQRFGVSRPFTHLVGKALTNRDYDEAARYILAKSSPYESEEMKEIRESLMDGAIDEGVLEKFPRGLRYERFMIKSLINHPQDYERAFSKIPPKMQTLFVHSYQSYLFNRIISLRIKEGLSLKEPEVGDFIIRLDKSHTGRDDWLFVTEQNYETRLEQVKSGEYGIASVIPGYTTKMPNTKQTEHIVRILKEDSTAVEDFRFPESRYLNSPGSLHLLSIELDKLDVQCIEEGLQIGFSLRKGSYATVVLREIMKNEPIKRT
ncbi:MAG: tRNA pseudouridine(13) synthase TruD [Candidatus Thorarchaeota archaeon]|nr:tRNA pseudouridine(13) synthase TruD [Candidatus Thorarchaeota archaeon]